MNFETFRTIFKGNVQKRSRTAKGVSDTSSTPGKDRLLLEGVDLSKQVEKNTERLIEIIWKDILMNYSFSEIPPMPLDLRGRMENWYDIINDKLQSGDAYYDKRKIFIEEAERLKMATGRNYRINPRYRLATPKYLIEKNLPIHPIIELEFQMDDFYQILAHLMAENVHYGTMDLPQLLAFADIQMDGKIHPWSDGCGRISTALVMWLSLWYGWKFPVFGDRDEHYSAIKANDDTAHVIYYEKCLEKKIL